MNLSPHFTLEEMTFSTTATRLGIDNTPSPAQVENLRLLCQRVLEPARLALGPIHINSGYRSPDLNKAVGGSRTSQHMDGQAADLSPQGCSLTQLYIHINKWLPFDQLIYEFSTWVHVSISSTPRRSLLVSKRSPSGLTIYREATIQDDQIV